MTSETKICQNCKTEFTIEPDDFAFYEKMKVPPPTFCSECRAKRRAIFRNERKFYRAKDAVTGKEIISGIPPDVGITIYESDYWWSDKWDPMDYGRDYDFSRPFFEQIKELIYKVPWRARNFTELVNSDYCNNSGWSKNCYLCFNSANLEDCAYLSGCDRVKNSFDVTYSDQGELCYGNYGSDNCYRVFFSHNCLECNEVWFSKNLTGCSYCFGCVNLRNKKYYIYNKPYSKEEYFNELKKIDLGSYVVINEISNKVEILWKSYPFRFMQGWRNQNVTGDYVYNSKNARNCFKVVDSENVAYCQNNWAEVKDSYDTVVAGNAELLYEVGEVGVDGIQNCKFSFWCWPSTFNLEYSFLCGSSSDLFGCVGLRKKQYCILNKQYSKESFFELREKIIQHMNEMPYKDGRGRIYHYGEFFPDEFSPFGYNETVAQEYFPFSKEQALADGFKWRDPEEKEYKTTLDAKNLQDHIHDVEDSVVNELIKCIQCSRAYRVIAMELKFYREIGLAIPRLCLECRFAKRMKFQNPARYYRQTCHCGGEASKNKIYENQTSHFHGSSSCPSEFETSYAPDRPEIVYCEQCYQAEVV